MNNFKHLDVVLINKVAEGDLSLINDLAGMFERQAPMFSQQLNTLFNNGDMAALGKLAHKIKGSVSTLGFSNFAIRMKELEVCATNNDYARTKELVSTFNPLCEEALAELKIFLTGH